MSSVRASFPTIDLSRLPAPQLVPRLSFEECRDAMIADFRARVPDFDAILASDPAIKVLEAAAYREMLLRAAINDVGRATMLAFAADADLDQLGAFYGLSRLIVVPATEHSPALLESDIEFRARLQLAPELLAGPGLTAGGYRVAVLTMAPTLKDVAVLRRAGGVIDLIVLGRDDDGTVEPSVVTDLATAFSDEAAVQLTDSVTVRAATIVPWSAVVAVTVRRGPDPELVRTEAEAAVRRYAADRHRIGVPVYAQMIEAAAAVAGVEHASVDVVDLLPAADAACFLQDLTVTVAVA